MTYLFASPLDQWIAARIGLAGGQRPTAQHLARYQLARLNQTLAFAGRHSPFYRRQWGIGGVPHLNRLEELGTLPFTTADDLRQAPMQMLSVSQGDVARVVTLNTSGTTGDPKRVFFSQADLEHTIDFFHHGMSTLVKPGQRVLILLPGDRPDSVGDLLRKGLARMNVEGFVHGPVRDAGGAIQAIIDHGIDCLVGIPVQVLTLARHPDMTHLPPGKIRSVLLSTDYVPGAVVAAIRQAWGCDVYQHYGMTEMGYGGGVSCAAHEGYHLRETDLLFEIIDPLTGQPVLPGQPGEVVFSTLTRTAMPLVRYRTGDLAGWIEGPCPCGSVLRRMGWAQGRRREMIRLADGGMLDLAALDEALLALPGVIDFTATVRSAHGNDWLEVTLHTCRHSADLVCLALAALQGLPALRAAQADGALTVTPVKVESGRHLIGSPVKRKIVDQRENPRR